MNLYQLRYFSLLAQTGHFRKTANQLCIAQSSLSHAIALMEQELGVSLFEKQGRRSVLTPEGAEFLKYRQVLSICREVLRTGCKSGNVRWTPDSICRC